MRTKVQPPVYFFVDVTDEAGVWFVSLRGVLELRAANSGLGLVLIGGGPPCNSSKKWGAEMTMTIASEAMVEACWPEEIPRDYEEMFKMYGGFVAATLRKHNKVGRNFEEMHAHIWKRLVEKDVIGLFMASITEKFKPTMTAVEACAYLGVSF